MTNRVRHNAFRLGAGLLVAGAIVHVATVWPRVGELADVVGPRSWMVVAGFAVSALTALAACALALLLIWKVPDRADARALTLFLAFLSIFWGSLFRFLELESTGGSVSVNLSYGGGWVSDSALATLVLAGAAFLRFSALFPRPLTSDRMRPMKLSWGPGRLRRALLNPLPVWGTAVAIIVIRKYAPRLVARTMPAPIADGQVPSLFIATLIAGLVLIVAFDVVAVWLGVRNLGDSLRTSDPGERDRILWVVAGFRAAAWMVGAAIGIMLLIGLSSVDASVLGAAIPLALVLAPLVLVIGASVGILYSGAIDPGLALKRSTVYGALGAMGVVGFTAIESAVSEAVESWLDLPGIVGSMAAGVMVTLALLAIRRALPGRPPDSAVDGGGT